VREQDFKALHITVAPFATKITTQSGSRVTSTRAVG
jgi:hypothetical protein